MNKPNLLFINGAQFGYSSGHYFYCKYLLESYNLKYICYDRGLTRLSLEGVDVCYVSFSGNKLFRSLRFLKECIKQSLNDKPNILFVTYFNVCFLLALFCKSGKTVLDIRTGSLRDTKILREVENFFILLQSLFFNRVIILSDSLRNRLTISAKKSKVVPLGSEIYFTGNHNFNTINLLYLGAFNHRNIGETIKGLHLFLQSYKGEAIKISYTIIGFGSEAETLKIVDGISQSNFLGIVEFLGRKTNEELLPYFERSNIGIVFVPQTAGYDCQPVTKLFEYMLAGMPVIATNTYENRLVINGNNGILIDDSAEDFCKGLMSIYNLRNSFDSSYIRKSVASNTWENIVNTSLRPFLQDLLL